MQAAGAEAGCGHRPGSQALDLCGADTERGLELGCGSVSAACRRLSCPHICCRESGPGPQVTSTGPVVTVQRQRLS